ncbi:hypothetical protein [Wolbachia endosymbiont (group E) of Neria commutata]|uniref:hypothetical protein n=1 Tax=Wolbachia endosymbiont (group E) of Neria commutata TaxID=3066149 RepID=UPI0031333378
MSANSGNVVFKKTFKIEKGVSLDRIYPNLTQELVNNDMKVQLQSQFLPKYQALIKDTESKRVIGEFPMFGVYFHDDSRNKSLKVVYPYHYWPLITSSDCISSTNCTLKLEVDSNTNYYDFLVSGNRFIQDEQKLTKSEILGLQNFDFMQYHKAKNNGHLYQIRPTSDAIVQSGGTDRAIQYSAELHDTDSETTYFLPSKYCMFNNNNQIVVCKTDKCEIVSRSYYITLVKRQSGYEWYFSDQSGTRNDGINVTFSLDEINIDHALLKQMELEQTLNRLATKQNILETQLSDYEEDNKLLAEIEKASSSTKTTVGLTDSEAEIVAEKLLEREGKLKHVIYNAQVGGRRLPELLEPELMKDENFKSEIMNTVRRSLTTLSTEVAKEHELQTKISEALRINPGNAKGPPGQNGIAGATAGEVADVLVNQRATELGKAVINADLLNQQYPLSSKITYWVKDLLRRDQEFRNDVKGPAGPQGPVGPSGQNGTAGATAGEVADVLVNQKAHDLGKAVLGVKVGGRGSDKDKSKLSLELATNSDLQQGVANKLKTDPGKARGPEGKVGPIGPKGPEGKQGQKGEKGDKGDSGAIGPRGPIGNTGAPGKDGAVGPEGPQGPEGKQGPIGPPAEKGDPGKDSDPSEIVHRLAHSSRFKRSLKGEDGEPGYEGKKGNQGQPGIEGLPGLDGRDGRDADPAEVAEKLISNKTDELVNIIRQEVVDRVTTWGASKRLVDSLTYDDIIRIIEGKADTGRHKLFERLLSNADLQDPSKAKTFIGNEVAGNADLQNAVADALRNDPGNARGPRGRDGRKGERGEDGAAGPRGDLGQDADSSEIVHRLAHSSRFKRSLKGEDGPEGPQGERGEDGAQGPEGPQGIKGERGEDGVQGLEGPQGPRGEKGGNGMPGPPGPAGRDGVNSFALDSKLQKSIEDLQKKPALKIVPGDTNENIQEANIELEGVGVIATFLEIGYFFKGNNLYIRNHITGKSILIPQDFHFLKVVEDGLDNYKLAFCNYLGNLFFDYKKYNSEYANVLEEYKTIDLRYIKNAANIDLSKYYYMHSPLFAVKQGEFEAQSTENRSADVYEIVKDKKIGTLIDEFGFFQHKQFYYVNHHQRYDHRSQELNVTIEDHEGNFQIGDNIIHPIILHDGRFDLLDYLGYQNEFM